MSTPHTPPFLSRVTDFIENNIPDNHVFLVLIAPVNTDQPLSWFGSNVCESCQERMADNYLTHLRSS